MPEVTTKAVALRLVKHSRYRLSARTVGSFLLFSALLCTSCATRSRMMESWMDNHQSQLILSWGPPNRTASDGAGGTILIYEEAVQVTDDDGYTATRMFYVNPSGIIYAWRWQGL